MMAFNFTHRSTTSIAHQACNATAANFNTDVPKLTPLQLKEFPLWLKDGSVIKQLPGIYLGVLGQVQLQPDLNKNDVHNIIKQNNNNRLQTNYMNRFTDTERVRQLLSASRLSNEVLATIWAHVNKTCPGRLTNREVCFALALIAIFQKLDNSISTTLRGNSKSPFELVKLEKKPPVPKLYPVANEQVYSSNNHVPASKSVPEDLGSGALLIDIIDDNINSPNQNELTNSRSSEGRCTARTKLNLIDTDGDQFEEKLDKLSRVWASFLGAMKMLFKRSFDVLMVEHDRRSAIEALSSIGGQSFIRNLCMCYPLSHNIKMKIDELKTFQTNSMNSEQNFMLDENYIDQTNDLMTSVNEYWAVLINLFHESGQAKFVELIMDGLNYETKTIVSSNIDELTLELSSSGKRDTCAICHTHFYLTNCNEDSIDDCGVDKADLLGQGDLISNDSEYYYHARCANFWLNHVDSTTLPFEGRPQSQDILSPITTTTTAK